MAEPVKMPFGLWTPVIPRKHVLGGVHTGATWRIPLNLPCVAVMRLFVKLLWPLVILILITSSFCESFVMAYGMQCSQHILWLCSRIFIVKNLVVTVPLLAHY